MDQVTVQALFREAAQLAEQGECHEAARAYERLVSEARSPMQSSELSQLLRSVYFNLAQVLNKLGEFQRAASYVEEGLRLSPTDFGRAIAFSAKGEALFGLGQIDEAMAAFREAVLAHPVVGRLNAADSMTRLGSDEALALSEEWVEHVVRSFGSDLKPQWWSEVDTIRGKIAVQRGDYAVARAQFESALRADPGCADAKLQLRLLPMQS